MRRPLLAKAREGLRIVEFAVGFAFAALVVNVLVMLVFTTLSGSLHDERSFLAPPNMEQLADGLTLEQGEYTLPDDVSAALRTREQWAMLIDEEGSVVWAFDLPEDVPRHYTMSDVASFSRWYLSDYPVVTRVRDDGILVMGSPKGAEWKYSFSTNMNTIVLTGILFVALFAANVIVAIVVVRGYARRSWAERDHARREWVAAVSHDVRTPLAVALADADTLAGDDVLDESRRARASRIASKIGDVASLVGDLNAANRLSYAMEPVDAEPVMLAPIVRAVAVDAMNDDADGLHPITVDVDKRAETFAVMGSASLFRRMVVNLVRNSVRHNPNGCSVHISLTEAPRRIFRKRSCLLTVEDDGRGLDADMLHELKRPPSGDLPEHGLGLVIVRRIASSCRGEARFMESEGGGTRVEIRLPLAP
ncbi:Signal-transduction histidine kinase senX3 [Slackia heliotrinireducens]|uniref:Sensor-like histidine kinase SenX3 n=1 Tax=Slackia heliotrinireducens (strain ATCC 29202 / DSM 20476 / NCTC 11029 / RHS 1) TaxID=471855 RepID=C7N3P3_SLAHD|nr:HAMP domain-containing sensor histidine kinase [Slackia heliotrinireducens]ACV21634.1 signal transduction histidine kinase [Slackia heliotrinireducens DSM 20476]VEG99210.1 Signal-transduction histidine kinase senX3 [Slackia heliotrinireducens]